jgi:hypothetical protein
MPNVYRIGALHKHRYAAAIQISCMRGQKTLRMPLL